MERIQPLETKLIGTALKLFSRQPKNSQRTDYYYIKPARQGTALGIGFTSISSSHSLLHRDKNGMVSALAGHVHKNTRSGIKTNNSRQSRITTATLPRERDEKPCPLCLVFFNTEEGWILHFTAGSRCCFYLR